MTLTEKQLAFYMMKANLFLPIIYSLWITKKWKRLLSSLLYVSKDV